MREIIGRERLRAVPSPPGIYAMSGRVSPHAEPEVLYVGKSINLRRRLAGYRGIKSGRASPRLVRLAFAVESITWETCADDHEARLRENSLLRLHRPKFVSANTHPESHRYAVLRTGNAFVELDWVSEPCDPGLQRAHWVALNPPKLAQPAPPAVQRQTASAHAASIGLPPKAMPRSSRRCACGYAVISPVLARIWCRGCETA
jgi:hypothetical protein